jgi:hypothetical protein
MLAVYSIQRGSVSKETKGLESYQLNLVYQHKLSRSAFSMCIGPFGGVQGKDYMCVQSIDGTLNLFENESFAFSRFLPGFLLPGPMAYVGKTDSFVTVSSSFQLESYKYKNHPDEKTRLKLHSVLTRENPRLLSTYKTDRSNRKQDKTAGLRPGRAELLSNKTGTRLPAYGRTRLGHDCQPMAGQDCWPMAKQDC